MNTEREPWDEILETDLPTLNLYKGTFMRSGDGWNLRVEREGRKDPPPKGTEVEVMKRGATEPVRLLVTEVVYEHLDFWECRFREPKSRR